MLKSVKSHNTETQETNNLKTETTYDAEKLGKRRKLTKILLNYEAIQYTIDELTPGVDTAISYSSEYNDNFCNFTLSSLIDDNKIRVKHPLYGDGYTQTIYNQLMMEGVLKNRNAIANVISPFKRNSVISLLPENNLNVTE